MASLKDIRARIQSTKNTQQITRAVKMVSSAKLRRSQQHILNLRPYAGRIQHAIQDIQATHRVSHPLMSQSGEVKNVLIILYTSDRGLCGAFNNSVSRYAMEFYKEQKATAEKVDVITIGRKGYEYFKKRGVNAVENLPALERTVSLALATELSEKAASAYTKGEYDAVYVIYNEFKSALAQIPKAERLLPIQVPEANEEVEGFARDMIFEPAPEQMINELLHKYFSYQLYRTMYDSLSSEHGARMTSMENATKNASEMIRVLTLTYNKLRQASITTELIEITSGAEALKG